MAISEAEWHQPGTQIYYKQLTEQRRKFKETLEGFELSSVLESRKSSFLDVKLDFVVGRPHHRRFIRHGPLPVQLGPLPVRLGPLPVRLR